MKQKSLVIVLGMHRSGTSAIARGLECIGVSLGNNLIPQSFDNKKGFWEDRDLVQINEAVLQAKNEQWYGSEVSRKIPWDSPQVMRVKEQAIEIIRSRTDTFDIFGFKDPRTVFNLDFWKKIFDEVGAAPKYIITLRNPLDVAKSLEHRNAIHLTKALYLWANAFIQALDETEGQTRVVTSYEEMLVSPKKELARIAQELQLKLASEQKNLHEYTNTFLDANLRHNATGEAETTAILANFQGLPQLYKLACELSEDTEYFASSTFLPRFAKIKESFAKVGPLLSLYVETDISRISSEKIVADCRIEANEIRDSLAALTKKNSRLDSDLRICNERNRALESSLSWKITAPLRYILDKIVTPLSGGRVNTVMSKTIQCAWDLLPASRQSKDGFKRLVFKNFTFFFQNTNLYREWVDYQRAISGEHAQEKPIHGDLIFDSELKHRRFEDRAYSTPPEHATARLIAFYLPQFHVIPENEEWWGAGFTEWKNVRPATQKYEGHYQPRIPDTLGYYSLKDESTLLKQVELARTFGLEAFCFYFYWFAGKRLLELPLINFLNNRDIDFPFCLCWANENWSRSWDGLDNELLIGQKHSPSDDINFIRYISRYLSDERYLRVDGKPVILIYRPNLLPEPVESAHRWRAWCSENGIGEIYLVTTQSFESVDPKDYGFDAATEFPPNNTAPREITEFAPNLSRDFKGHIYDWTSVANRSKNYTDPGYKLFRAVNPGWDNTARRKNKATILAGATPGAYERWLHNAIKETHSRFSSASERLVFINAWNEWAEGAYLEPDKGYGFAYLNSTRRALQKSEKSIANRFRRVLLVTHDAHPHGAQFLILNMAKYFSESFGFKVDIITLGRGPLFFEYQKYGRTFSLADKDPGSTEARTLVSKLKSDGHKSVICNTTVSGLFCETLKRENFYVVSLIHELPQIIKSYELEKHAESISNFADKIVFPSSIVLKGFRQFTVVSNEKIVIRPQGLYKRNSNRSSSHMTSARKRITSKHSIPDKDRIVICVGYADSRKGADLFVDIGLKVLTTISNVSFIWLGNWENSIYSSVISRIKREGLQQKFIFPGFSGDTDDYFSAADIYALTSREDPFPSVVLESLDARTPVIAFSGTGGAENLISRGCGKLVEPFNTGDFSKQVIELLQDEDQLNLIGSKGRNIVEQDFSFRKYLFDILEYSNAAMRKISVIVPNYNYAQYLTSRINSILAQTYPIYEIIVLDDSSVDESLLVISRLLAETEVDYQLVVNKENSGSVFHQWAKGALCTKGDLIWIAEADDLAEPEFLETVVAGFENSDVVMSYCESKQIDEYGKFIGFSYSQYTDDISKSKWLTDYYTQGLEEIKTALSIKNTIPNVSAVLFRADSFKNIMNKHLEEILSLRFTGDWLFYVYLLENGDIAFFSDALNIHRRHSGGVTLSDGIGMQCDEILGIQKFISSKYDLTAETENIARNYIRKLGEQFGIEVE